MDHLRSPSLLSQNTANFRLLAVARLSTPRSGGKFQRTGVNLMPELNWLWQTPVIAEQTTIRDSHLVPGRCRRAEGDQGEDCQTRQE
jgi:hypothetical protein